VISLRSYLSDVIIVLVFVSAMAPRLVIAANSQSFDQVIISHWQEEGFEVRFEPVHDDSKPSIRSIESIGDSLENGEKYAVVSRPIKDEQPWL